MPSLDLEATIDANVDPYQRGIDRAIASTMRYEAQLNSLESDMMKLQKSIDDDANAALQRQNDALDKTGRAFLVFGAVATAAFALAGNEAVKWESAWAGVTKTTSGTTEQMGALEDQLRNLALTLPATHEQIAATAEAAGQLGVAREDIAAFTKTAIDLGETTNLSADQAATAIAQIMNVMGSAPEVVDRLGATLVALGNDGASTESEILSMAQRLTGAVKLIGGSESDVLGLASAMANLGIQAELGGGAMSRTLLTIYKMVASGGEGLERFAKFAGTSAAQFADAWAKDPVRALDMFIQGMGRSRAEGRNLVQELELMGFKGTQNMQVLLRLAGAGSELTDALDLSSQAWEDNLALIVEAEKRYQTTESKIKIARNQLRDGAIDMGAIILPALVAVLQFTGDLMRAWSDLPGPLKATVWILGALAAAVGVFGGAAMIAIPQIAAFKAAVDGLSAGALKTAGSRLIGLGSILAGPWGLALAGGVAALTIFAAKQGAAAREVDALKATLDAQTGAITQNSAEWAVKKLSDEGILDDAKKLGLSLGTIADAALGNKDAIATLNGEYARLMDTMPRISRVVDGKTYSSIDTSSTQYQALEDIRGAIDGTNGTLDEARTKWQLENEAIGSSTVSKKRAADGQGQLNSTLTQGADATSQLTEEVKTLGQQLDELSGNYLDNRAAGRAVRDSLRSIRDATRQYIKDNGDLDGAFKAGTKSGDEFAGLLDSLAGDLQTQIDTTERVTGSQEAVMQRYRDSRQTLLEVAESLGMSKQAAKDYADQVLQTPELVKTMFEMDGTDTALGKLDKVALRLQALQSLSTVTFGLAGFTSSLPTGSPGGKPSKPGKGGSGGGDGSDPNPQLPNATRLGARAGAWSAAAQQMGTWTPRQAGGPGSQGVTVVRESGPLIGELKVELSGSATRDDARRLATAIVNEVSLAQRSNRWSED